MTQHNDDVQAIASAYKQGYNDAMRLVLHEIDRRVSYSVVEQRCMVECYDWVLNELERAE